MDSNTVITYRNTLGSVVFSATGPYWLSGITGASGLEVDHTKTQTPGAVGATLSAASVRPRTLTLDGCLFQPSVYRKKLLDVVVPGVAATLTVRESGEEWFLQVEPTRTPEIAPGPYTQDFQLQLLAAYPYWRSTHSRSVQIAGLVPAFRLPFFCGGSFWLSQYSASYFQNVPNTGNVAVPFTLVFAAAARVLRPWLMHMGTRRRISFVHEMQPGERITLCTVPGQKSVVLRHADGSEENGLRFLQPDSDFAMALAPGENLLRLGAEENREGLSCRLSAVRGVRSGV